MDDESDKFSHMWQALTGSYFTMLGYSLVKSVSFQLLYCKKQMLVNGDS